MENSQAPTKDAAKQHVPLRPPQSVPLFGACKVAQKYYQPHPQLVVPSCGALCRRDKD